MLDCNQMKKSEKDYFWPMSVLKAHLACTILLRRDGCNCDNIFSHHNSTKHCDLTQEEDSALSLSGAEINLNSDDIGDDIMSYSCCIVNAPCVIGLGWVKVNNHALTTCVTCQDDFIAGEDDSGSRRRRSSGHGDRSVAKFEADASYDDAKISYYVGDVSYDEATMDIKFGAAKLSREVSAL